MTPEDRDFARTCVERGWLTIDQVEEIKRVVEERKMPFRDVAVSFGVVREKSPPPSPPTIGCVLLGTLALFVAGSMVTLAIGIRESRAREVENARDRAEREGPGRGPGHGSDTVLRIEAERRLRHARESLRYVEDSLRTLPQAERVTRLEESLAGFDAYLAFAPDAAAVYCDRARARDVLGRLPDALADYEKAMVLDPQFTRTVAPRVRELRRVLDPK